MTNYKGPQNKEGYHKSHSIKLHKQFPVLASEVELLHYILSEDNESIINIMRLDNAAYYLQNMTGDD